MRDPGRISGRDRGVPPKRSGCLERGRGAPPKRSGCRVDLSVNLRNPAPRTFEEGHPDRAPGGTPRSSAGSRYSDADLHSGVLQPTREHHPQRRGRRQHAAPTRPTGQRLALERQAERRLAHEPHGGAVRRVAPVEDRAEHPLTRRAHRQVLRAEPAAVHRTLRRAAAGRRKERPQQPPAPWPRERAVECAERGGHRHRLGARERPLGLRVLLVHERRAIGLAPLGEERGAAPHHSRIGQRHQPRTHPCAKVRIEVQPLDIAAPLGNRGAPAPGRVEQEGITHPRADARFLPLDGGGHRAAVEAPEHAEIRPRLLAWNTMPALELPHHQQRSEVGRHGVEARERHDARAVARGGDMMPVDEVPHPRRLARDVHVVGAKAHARLDHPAAVHGKGARGAEQHAGARHHRVDRRLVGAIGHEDIHRMCGGQQTAHRLQPAAIAARDGPAQAPGGVRREVRRRLATGEPARAVQHHLVCARRHAVVGAAGAIVCRRTAGATTVPNNSIERIIWSCGIVPTLICAR